MTPLSAPRVKKALGARLLSRLGPPGHPIGHTYLQFRVTFTGTEVRSGSKVFSDVTAEQEAVVFQYVGQPQRQRLGGGSSP